VPFAFLTRSRVPILVLAAAFGLAGWLVLLRDGSGPVKVAHKCPLGYAWARGEEAREALEAANGTREADGERGEAGGIGDGACINLSRPEGPGEISRFSEAASRRFGSDYPKQRRRALRQRARLADSKDIPGANGTWKPLGVGPLHADDPQYGTTYGDGYGLLAGRISDYAYDATTNRLWATVAQGGVWESTDLGDNWRPISNGLPIQSTSGIAFTPAGGDGGTLVVVTGDHAFSNDYSGVGVYYTTDDGKTWHHAKGVPDGALGFNAAVDPTNPRRIYAATGFGLYRSDDAGRSFENVKLPTGDCAGDSTKPNCFFANIVTSVAVQPADKHGHKGGKVAAAVGWRAGPYPNFNGKPQAPANGMYVSDTGATGSFSRVGDDAGITHSDEFGRTELAATAGGDQDSEYLYALVQNSKYFREGTDVGDLGPGCDPLIGLVCANSGSVVDGVFVSHDFGRTWTVMENHDQFANDVTSGSSITQLRPAGIAAGYQVTYNEWIKVDPTMQDSDGTPTHLVFGMEELWQNDPPGQPMNGQTKFQVFGPYNQAGFCLLVALAETCGQTQQVSPRTTHPDQHGGIILPDKNGGTFLLAGNDGGNYKQHSSDSGGYTREAIGDGNQAGFHTLLPYGVAMAKDGTVYAGLQDNGQLKIDPNTGRQDMVFGGDAIYTVVNPGNSDEVIEMYPTYAIMQASTDGGRTWHDIAPNVDDADFVGPLVQDPLDYKHIAIAGRQVLESTSWTDTTFNCHKDPGGSSSDPTCGDIDTDWNPVFDLGTQKHPGDKDAEATDDDPGNHAISQAVYGPNQYVGFCGSCDPVKLHQRFHSGIATNVGGSKPPGVEKTDGWHIAAAKGLPQRIITGITIDPKNPRTVYVTLGQSAARPFAPLGSLGDDTSQVKGGYVYKSTDAGESFTDVTGNLPKIQAGWVRLKGNQLVVATAIGMFISKDTNGSSWAELGQGFPSSPVYSFEFEPQDPEKIVVASFGRGIWEYDFRKRPAGAQAVMGSETAGANLPCVDKTGPTSRFLRNIRSAAQRRGRSLVLRGTAAWRACKGGPNGRVARVLVTLKFKSGKRCRYLTKKGRLGKRTSCKRRARYFTARGREKWSFRIRGPLPRGRYVAYVKSTDNLGNRERRTKHRNFRHFRLRPRSVAAGWHGKQPAKVPPPGHPD
jgi:hypothetical protein